MMLDRLTKLLNHKYPFHRKSGHGVEVIFSNGLQITIVSSNETDNRDMADFIMTAIELHIKNSFKDD